MVLRDKYVTDTARSVGKDVTHAELAAHHHAVVYAVGAAADKTLGISGEGLDGSSPTPTSPITP